MAKTKDYLISSKTTRLMFILSAIGMIAALIGILLLASARPQGKFVSLDTSLQEQLVEAAKEQLNNYHNNEDGTVAIPIDLAMDIVSERGFDEVLANANLGSSPSTTDSNTEVSGEDVYKSNCASCHQATGAGIPGAFPPLAASAINHAKNNRDYLPSAVLFGLMGEIDVNGQTYNGAMPAWKHLSDNEISAVINYVISAWDDSTGIEKYTPDEIAVIRAKNLGNSDILDLRSKKAAESVTTEAVVEETNPETTLSTSTETATEAVVEEAVVEETNTETALSTSTETATETVATTTTAELSANGQAVYDGNCASCHQATGKGIAGAFPPLAGNVVNYAKNNRDYLPSAVLFGLMGEIDVNGQTYNGAMPAWKHLSDNDIADVINHIISNWDNATGIEPYIADEVAAIRSKDLSFDDVLKLRSISATASATDQTTTEAALSTATETTVAAAAFDWQEIGESAYNNCSACHQANGNGIPGAFPALNKNAANLYNTNRDYLALTVITGISGAIEVDGQSYNGAMPAWAHLSDEQIAGVLNHVLSSWDNPSIAKDFKAYSPEEIKAYRELGLSSEEVLSLRP